MNEDKKYYLNINEQNVGPLTQEEVLDRLNNGLLNTDDYIFITGNDDWIKIKESSDFIEYTKDELNKENNTWFYRKNKQNIGPVSIAHLLDLIPAGELDINDYVWKKEMPNWMQIKDIPELNQPSTTEPIAELKKEIKTTEDTDPAIIAEPETKRSLELINVTKPEEKQMYDKIDLDEGTGLKTKPIKKQKKLLPEFIFGIILMLMGGYQINNNLVIGGLIAFIGFILTVAYLISNRKRGSKDATIE